MNSFRQSIWILVVALIIRVAAAYYWQSGSEPPTYYRFGDSDTYWYLATTIANGEPYQYGSPNSRVFRAPLYPFVLSPAALLVPSGERTTWLAVFVGRLIGCLLGSLGVGLVAYQAVHLIGTVGLNRTSMPAIGWGPAVGCSGCGAAWLAALYPGAIGMSVFLLSESLFCPLMMASLIATQFSIRRPSCDSKIDPNASDCNGRWMMGISGFFSGLACLTRPSWSLWPVVLFPYLFWTTRSQASRPFRRTNWICLCGLYCVGLAVAMCPWWARNYLVTGKFVPTTLQVGPSLYDGWHSGASGSSDENMEFVLAFAKDQANDDELVLKRGEALESTYEWRLNRRLQNAAIEWAFENSPDALWLGLVKFAKTWTPLPVARELGSDSIRWMEAFGYLSIVLLALLGMQRVRHVAGGWLCAMPCVYFAVLHMFFIGSVRCRQPAVLAACVLGGIGLVAIWNRLGLNIHSGVANAGAQTDSATPRGVEQSQRD